jgi:hypothetical protein
LVTVEAVAGRFPLDHFLDAVNGRLFKVGQVHADLGLSFDQETHRLHEAEAAAGEADGRGNLLSDLHIVAVEVQIVGDEERPDAYHRRPPGLRFSRAEVGIAGWILADFVAPFFVLPFADVGQFFPLRAAGGRAVEVNGHA